VAETGAWMGGPLPYGYRKPGNQRGAPLVLSEEPIGVVGISEADVVRRIFHQAAVEQQSCRRIADYLNALGVPCVSARNGQPPAAGKKVTVPWCAARGRNLLISTTYKGEHQYGKRSRGGQRPVIRRSVPAIVSETMQDTVFTIGHSTHPQERFIALLRQHGIEVISIAIRPVSLSFRLFGNMYAGETLLHTMSSLGGSLPFPLNWLCSILFPLPFYFLELLVGLLQAFVFAMLCAVYIKLSTEHEGGSEAH
jgi:hypothetical protein